MKKGEILNRENLEILRPCPINAIKPSEINLVLGKKLKIDLNEGDTILKKILFHKMNRVLVTGAAGSVGKALVNELIKNDNVVCAFDSSEDGLFKLRELILKIKVWILIFAISLEI